MTMSTKSSSAYVISLVVILGCFGLTNIALAQEKWAPCKPVQAATYTNRIHVKCEAAVDGKFLFFAASTADAKFAARALSVIEAGQLGDKFVSILFDPSDKSGQAFGCDAVSCRQLLAVVLTEDRPGKCDIDNTQRSCPGFCAAVGNNDRSCPGFCAAGDNNKNDKNCPGYCTAHPTARGCPGYCTDPAHAEDPICGTQRDPCAGGSHAPGCRENPR
jgi:hypothetical protein